MFAELKEIIPANGTLQITLKAKDGKLNASILPVFPITDVTIPGKSTYDKESVTVNNITPLLLSGSIEDFDAEFINAVRDYTPAVIGFQSNVTEAKASFDAKLAEMKDKADAKKKNGSKSTPTPEVDRTEGDVDEEKVKTLTHVPASDGNFLSAIKDANLPTLEDALTNRMSLTNAEAIAKEIKKINGKDLAETLTGPLSAWFKSETDPGQKDQIGKRLVKITGKSLEELNLVAKTLSLLG
ncbi:PRTRC system protein E [Pseudodesulfovibrio pelocollis]|uniref:PRTRC system protein E n=1 Tax=Pseudodesulfovibrio pelocollis TaxID=3051432 RepID=UPI00255A847A|nr:PRTRC system protein E [Pseudodesulfovibrio sp. SB368]